MNTLINYQDIFGEAFGVKDDMFNPYSLNSIYGNYNDFIGILNTRYFADYLPIAADFWNVGSYIQSSMKKYENTRSH